MLGLGSALTTGSVHEQMYSLTLDGTGDHLVQENAFTSIISGTDGFTISTWLKMPDGQPSSKRYICGTFSATDKFVIYVSTAGLIVVEHEGDNGDVAVWDTDAAVFADGAIDWTHLAVTVTYNSGGSTAYIIYVDKDVVASSFTGSERVSAAEHAAFETGYPFGIGGRSIDAAGTVGSTIWTGNLDDFAIFDAVLDSAAIVAVYNSGKPFDLNYDRGNYDNSSDLQGYWRMGNGPFDDKIQGVVHDAHNPGYGAELWDGTDGDDANWVVYASNTKAEDDGAVKITYVDSTNGAKIILKDATDLNTDLTVGATYRLTWDAKVNTSSVKINTTGIINDTQIVVDSTDFAGYTMYMIAESTDADLLFVTHMTTGEIVWIKNISLKKLNGYPGITVADAAFSTDTPDD